MTRALDPRKCNVSVDANAVDHGPDPATVWSTTSRHRPRHARCGLWSPAAFARKFSIPDTRRRERCAKIGQYESRKGKDSNKHKIVVRPLTNAPGVHVPAVKAPPVEKVAKVTRKRPR
jgi:hypothetical protein